jgi:hypothetical protein
MKANKVRGLIKVICCQYKGIGAQISDLEVENHAVSLHSSDTWLEDGVGDHGSRIPLPLVSIESRTGILHRPKKLF